MYYFAYGSNMDESQMSSKKVNFSQREKGILYGYRLTFNKKTSNGSGRATIVISEPDDFVEGVLYEIDEGDLPKLDKPERYPVHYSRIEVKVSTERDPAVPSIVYIANPQWIEENLKPMESYLDTLLKAKDFLSDSYYSVLSGTQIIPQEKRRIISGEEIYSEKLIAAGRTYFFDIKQNSRGDYYVAISESKKTQTGFERHRIMIFEDHMGEFNECVNNLSKKLATIPKEITSVE